MATYDITSNSFNVDNISEGDILNCPYTGSETSITLPPGVYKFTTVGATGNFGGNKSTTNTTYTRVGGGGTSIGNFTAEDDITLYINVGGCGNSYTGTSTNTRAGGYNGGGSANAYGGVGGGATHIATRSGLLSSLANFTSDVLIVAGGGGGSNYYSGNSTYYGNGGSGGGTTGAAGTKSGSANTSYCGQGGTQTAGGAAGTNSTRRGTAGSFGQGGNNTSGTSSYASSAGGGGYYGGGGGSNEESGGGGGSGYVSSVLTNASTTQGSATSTYTNGSVTIEVIELLNSIKYNLDLTLSGGNYTSDHTNGTTQKREGLSETISFIPLNSEDPVNAYKNNVDITNQLQQATLTSALNVTTTAPGASYGFALSNGYYVSQNKGVSKSAAVARVNITAVQKTTVTFDVINYAEEGYDFGVLGLLDTPLEQVYNSDNSGYWSGFSSDHNKSTVQTVTYTVPIGEHFIDVKYIKDDATDSNNDTLQFKVSMNPAAGSTVKQYTLNTGAITGDTTIKIVCGDISSNFNIRSTGEHASIDPEDEQIYKGSNLEIHFIPTDTTDYRYIGVLDNNVNVTRAVIAPHTLSNPTYTVENVSGASYGFTLSDGYYQSQNTSNNTAALCHVIFNTPVAARVTVTYQNTGNGTNNFSMISELNTELRTDYATDTSGIYMNGSSNFHSSDTSYSIDIPAGESFITCKHKISSNSGTKGNLKFKISIEALESLEIPYYTYSLTNIQEVHNIIILSEKIPVYTINATCGPMGNISPSGTISVKEGGSVTITGTADTNYEMDKVFLNSTSVTFSGNSYTLSNIQGDANIYVLFSSGDTKFYIKEDNGWREVVQAYIKNSDGRWVEQEFALIGDPNTKYQRKN